MGFFKAFRIMGILTTWMEKSIMDNVIDQDEVVDLLKAVMNVLGVKAEIKVNMK